MQHRIVATPQYHCHSLICHILSTEQPCSPNSSKLTPCLFTRDISFENRPSSLVSVIFFSATLTAYYSLFKRWANAHRYHTDMYLVNLKKHRRMHHNPHKYIKSTINTRKLWWSFTLPSSMSYQSDATDNSSTAGVYTVLRWALEPFY